MEAYIVETNVAIVANDRAGQTPAANRACVLSCIRTLRNSVDILMGRREGVLAIDAGGEIMKEYRRHLHGSGQPGTGDAFFYEMSQREYGPTCERVAVTPDGDTYKEFLKTASLSGFDRSDRKFVAVALASQHNPTILNAVDSDWRHFQRRLEAEGIRIQQLCPDCLKRDADPR